MASLFSTVVAGVAGALFAGLTASAQAAEPVPQRPNVLLIQADDLGFDDLGIHGNRLVETPNLDRLAQQSVQCRNYLVNPVCAASRATLLTGRHFLRTGVAHVHGGKDFMHFRERTIAEVLRNSGYATGMWGKWHVGHTDGYYPWQRGFDEALMLRLYKHQNAAGSLNGKPVETQKWGDEVVVDHALEFMRKNKDRPFFAYVPSMTPHTPLVAPQPLVEHYLAKGLTKNLATLYAMVHYLDQQVGRLLAGLEELGLAENTIVLFMSDNGPAISNEQFGVEDQAIRKVNNLRGWKGDIWENGVRSPLFVRWPAKLKPRVEERMIDQVDVFPTLVEVCSAALSADQLPLDGRSAAAFLQDPASPWPERVVFNYANPGWPPVQTSGPMRGNAGEYMPVTPEEKPTLAYGQQVISARTGRYKLLLNANCNVIDPALPMPDRFLVDLGSDPRELINVASLHPEETQRLEGQLVSWWQSILAEEASFGSPVFLIGSEPGSVSTVPAKGPVRVSAGLTNGLFAVSGWQVSGEAEYRIRVAAAGEYHVDVTWLKPIASGTAMEITAGAGSVQGALQAGKAARLGTLRLAAGDTLLKVRVTELPPGGAAADQALERLEFTRVAD